MYFLNKLIVPNIKLKHKDLKTLKSSGNRMVPAVAFSRWFHSLYSLMSEWQIPLGKGEECSVTWILPEAPEYQQYLDCKRERNNNSNKFFYTSTILMSSPPPFPLQIVSEFMFIGAPNTFYLPFPPPQVSFKQQTDKAVALKNTNGDEGREKRE